jgi:hypothetical protein
MIKLRINAYLLLTGTIILLIVAALCNFVENSMDIIFFGAGVFLAATTIRQFRKFKAEKKFLSY